MAKRKNFGHITAENGGRVYVHQKSVAQALGALTQQVNDLNVRLHQAQAENVLLRRQLAQYRTEPAPENEATDGTRTAPS